MSTKEDRLHWEWKYPIEILTRVEDILLPIHGNPTYRVVIRKYHYILCFWRQLSYNSLKTAVDTIKDINKAEQQELPLKLQGENISDLPEDLYIPPNSLRIFLDSFEGPLDLLLYFIKKQNLDIANIDVSLITDQYISVSYTHLTLPTIYSV